MQYDSKCKLCWEVSVYYNFLKDHCNVSSNGKKTLSMLEGQQSLHFILIRIALLFIY